MNVWVHIERKKEKLVPWGTDGRLPLSGDSVYCVRVVWYSWTSHLTQSSYFRDGEKCKEWHCWYNIYIVTAVYWWAMAQHTIMRVQYSNSFSTVCVIVSVQQFKQ